MIIISRVSNEGYFRIFSTVLILLGSLMLSVSVASTTASFAILSDDVTSPNRHPTRSSISNRFQVVNEDGRVMNAFLFLDHQHDVQQAANWSHNAEKNLQSSEIYQLVRIPEKGETQGHLKVKNDRLPVTLATTGTPIRINGNADFQAQAAANGWPGNGTLGNPYVIENLVIVTNLNGTHAIDIRNTKVHFIIRNCTVTATGNYVNGIFPSGIYLFNVTNARLERNNASNNRYRGFYLHHSTNNMLVNNTASHNNDGFYLWYGANNNTLVNNTASHNRHGFYLYDSANNTLLNNVLINDGIVFLGSQLQRIVQARVEGNTVNGKPVLFFQHRQHVTVAGGNVGQVILINCSSIRVEKLVINSTSLGFQLLFSTGSTLINNTVSNSNVGFALSSSTGNTLINNTVSNNSWYGFYLWPGANNNTLVNNTVSNNSWYGFYLSSSTGNTLVNNVAFNNTYSGFYLDSSTGNTLVSNTASYGNIGFYLSSSSGNTLVNNTASYGNTGFLLHTLGDSASNNTLVNNTASYGNIGFYLDSSSGNALVNNTASYNTYAGFYLTGGSSNNVVKYNDLLFNNGGGVQAYSDNSTNTFDYNFWSDHLTPDYNDDGIVDVPYTIGGGTGVMDSHPVTRPHHQFPPFPPQNLQAVAGNGQVTLSWSTPVSDGGSPLIEYRVYRSTTSGSGYVLVASVADDVTTYTDDSVSNGVTYYYVVRAVNALGESANSNEVSVTPATVPSAPQNLQAVAGNGQVTLSWSAPVSDGGSPLIEYRVYRSTTSGSGYVLVASVADGVTTYTDDSVSNGVTYYYVVRAVNALGESANSNEVSVTLRASSSSTPSTTTNEPSTTSEVTGNDSNSSNAQVIVSRTIVVNTPSGSFTVFVVAMFVAAGVMIVVRRGPSEKSLMI